MQSDLEFKKIRNRKYYFLAHLGSKDFTHPAMQELIELAQDAKNILDLGCGEGTRINSLKEMVKKKAKWFGIDISSFAIKKAKKNYPLIKFSAGDLKKLPYASEEFDLLFSAFVFEHLENPAASLNESKRVLKKGGKFLIVAPNFGSPNRRSPNSNENKIKKLIIGFFQDLKSLLGKESKLPWKKVKPKKGDYTVDSDTTIEPYLRSLKSYSEAIGFNVVLRDSLWNLDRFSLFQAPFRILGALKIYPFQYWGPHLLIVLKK